MRIRTLLSIGLFSLSLPVLAGDPGVTLDRVLELLPTPAVYDLLVDDQGGMLAGVPWGMRRLAPGANVWMPVEGLPRDESIYCLARSVARLWAGGAKGLFRSGDGGLHWTAVDVDGLYPPVQALQADPSHPERLWASTDTQLFRSMDGGTSWSRVPLPEGVARPQTLVVHPDRSEELWAGCISGHLIHTQDGGRTWTTQSLTGHGNGVLHVVRIASRVYAATWTTVFMSEDGASWKPLPLTKGTDLGITKALLQDPKAPATLYAGTWHGVMRSEDGGRSWVDASSGLPRRRDVNALRTDPRDPGSLLAGLWSGGVWRSRDRGRTWVPCQLPWVPGSSISAFAVDAADPRRLALATNYGGILLSGDRGATWKLLEDTLEIPETWALHFLRGGGLLAGSREGDLWRQEKTPGGRWRKTSLPGTQPAWVHSFLRIGDDLLVCYRNGVLRSGDEGFHWTPTALKEDVNQVLPDPKDPGRLLAACDIGGIRESRDGGRHWWRRPPGSGTIPASVQALAWDPMGNGALFAGTASGLIHLRDGKSRRIEAFGYSYAGPAFSTSVPAPRLFFIRSGSGLLATQDGGATWETVLGDAGALKDLVTDPSEPGTFWVVGGSALWRARVLP